MARILRGEIRWANLYSGKGRGQAGFRPVLILSQDGFNGFSPIDDFLNIDSLTSNLQFLLTFNHFIYIF